MECLHCSLFLGCRRVFRDVLNEGSIELYRTCVPDMGYTQQPGEVGGSHIPYSSQAL